MPNRAGSPIAFARFVETSRERCCIGGVSASTVGVGLGRIDGQDLDLTVRTVERDDAVVRHDDDQRPERRLRDAVLDPRIVLGAVARELHEVDQHARVLIERVEPR